MSMTRYKKVGQNTPKFISKLNLSAIRNDPTPRKTRYVLSLDGGGTRGLAALQFLKRLEGLLGKSILDIFDGFVGVSAGALSLLSVVAAKSTASDVRDHIFSLTVMKQIFCKSLSARCCPLVPGIMNPRTRYDGDGKSEVIQAMLPSIGMDELVKPVWVPAWNLTQGRVCVFGPDCSTSIQQVADATSAAPVYFPFVQIDYDWYTDGGVCCNNPALVSLEAARLTWPDDHVKILSVGTGAKNIKMDGRKLQNKGAIALVANGLVDLLCNAPCSVITDMVSGLMPPGHFLRVDSTVPDELSQLDAIDDDTLQKLSELGDKWFKLFEEQLVSFFAVEKKVGVSPGSTSDTTTSTEQTTHDPMTPNSRDNLTFPNDDVSIKNS